MPLNPQTVLLMISAGAAIATAIFWGSFYLGKLTNDIQRAHYRLDGHDSQIGELLGRRRSDAHRDPRWET